MSAQPWSVLVRLQELGRDGLFRALEADVAARARIARMLNLVAVDSLTAEMRVKPWLDGVEIHGLWTGCVVQTCSLSADDFDQTLEGGFTVQCVPPDSPLAVAADETDIAVDPDAADPPDVLDGDSIDLAAYVVEHLALELDPFPRKPGALFEPPPPAAEPHPFDILARLKPTKSDDAEPE